MKKKVAAIVGPTASGKTALAIAVAKELCGEIISCDSMQIYKRMDIGTAKPTKEEMAEVPHHLIDIVEPFVEFSCADYAVLAKNKIDEITARNKLPVFCGGTGLYVDHVLRNTSFSEAGRDECFRAELQKEIENTGPQRAYEELCRIDPVAAASVHPNNTKRLVRALEIFHVTGKTKTEWDAESRMTDQPYDAKVVFLDYRNRELLYSRIDRRVDIMIENGLIGEVKGLLNEAGEGLSETALQAIGYKEIIEYLNGYCSLDEAVEKIKKNSRNYAKRQITWFKRYENYHRVFVDDCEKFDDIVNIAKKIFSN